MSSPPSLVSASIVIESIGFGPKTVTFPEPTPGRLIADFAFTGPYAPVKANSASRWGEIFASGS